jgi:predicted NBD/HSP70 family sugar kinase
MTSMQTINEPFNSNERKLLNIIRHNGKVPRHKIVEQMDITAQAVGQITKRLDQFKLLVHHKAIKVGLGQPPKPISIKANTAFSIGIKIGRRQTDIVLIDLLGAIQTKHTISYSRPVLQELLPQIGTHLGSIQTRLNLEAKQFIGVGLAVPFSLGGWHKLLGLSHAQADEWNSLDLVAVIETMTPKPVRLIKDTAAASIAEMLNGQGKNYNNFLYVFIDTFVGGGVIANGQWLSTTHGNAGAVASVPVQLETAKDQLLKYASLWELEERFRASNLDPLAAYDRRALDAEHLPHTEAWLDLASRSLAFAFVSGMAFLDTDAIVVDGSMDPEMLRQLLAKTNAALDDFKWEGLWRPRLIKGLLGSDAGAVGGAFLPLNEYFYA